MLTCSAMANYRGFAYERVVNFDICQNAKTSALVQCRKISIHLLDNMNPPDRILNYGLRRASCEG